MKYKVFYDRRCQEWHEKSNPMIVDENGEWIFSPNLSVNHPGIYDKNADELCQRVVNLLNNMVETKTIFIYEAYEGDGVDKWTCSNCNNTVRVQSQIDGSYGTTKWKYCPYCCAYVECFNTLRR